MGSLTARAASQPAATMPQVSSLMLRDGELLLRARPSNRPRAAPRRRTPTGRGGGGNVRHQDPREQRGRDTEMHEGETSWLQPEEDDRREDGSDRRGNRDVKEVTGGLHREQAQGTSQWHRSPAP